jgi:hypothetical protein
VTEFVGLCLSTWCFIPLNTSPQSQGDTVTELLTPSRSALSNCQPISTASQNHVLVGPAAEHGTGQPGPCSSLCSSHNSCHVQISGESGLGPMASWIVDRNPTMTQHDARHKLNVLSPKDPQGSTSLPKWASYCTPVAARTEQQLPHSKAPGLHESNTTTYNESQRPVTSSTW